MATATDSARRLPTDAQSAVLDELVSAARTREWAEAEELRLVADWAHSYPGEAFECASWADPHLVDLDEGGDGLDRLGGEGTPPVAQFAVEQLATRLGVSTGSAMHLVASALDLAHRHPVLWHRVLSDDCPARIARKVADACRALPAEAAAWVDARTGEAAGRVPWRVVEAKVAYATAKWDPARLAEAEHTAKDRRHVDLDFPTLARAAEADLTAGIATTGIRGVLDTVDAIKFEALVAEKATELARAGDSDPLPIRRAKAVGLIADQLVTGTLDLSDTASHVEVRAKRALRDGRCTTSSGTTSKPGSPGPVPGRPCLPVMLFVHVRIEDLAPHPTGATRLGTVERLGPATVELLADWLGRVDLRIRPVLDLARTDEVDQHDPPEWMRELVMLRDGHCVFPWCGRHARSCDLDHIDPYVPTDRGGPPGQTRPNNLAPLCRRHHRCKTFTRWRYRRGRDGTYEWTGPGGVGFRVDPSTGTTRVT
ncbi:MAG: hypothetical protein ACRDPH_04410 [Marmoricola sp.]